MPKMPAPLEVITGQRRRRRWTGEEKARIVAESFEEGANISEAARRNGVARGLLDLKLVLAAQPVDFRKSVHMLSALVSEALRANPYCGDVFMFRSKRMDRVKLLAWDGSGMVLVTKWLRQGRFTLPRQRLRSIPQTTFARKPQTKSQNLANSNTAKAQSTLQFRAFLVLHGRLIQLRHLP
jgi:transposase